MKALWVAVVVVAGACDYGDDPTPPVPADPVVFENEVYPILLADCGFPGCHGNTERFFSVFGPGRTRLDPDTRPYDPPTPRELALSFTRARSMLTSPDGPRRAPLLRKPLAVPAGGSGHAGDDPWGASIYSSKADPRYEALFFWAIAGEADP